MLKLQGAGSHFPTDTFLLPKNCKKHNFKKAQ